MKLITDTLFQALFNSPVPRIIVKADAPLFTIVLNNDAHKVATNKVGINITGKSVWEVFSPEEAGGDGGDVLMKALTKAQFGNEAVLMPPFRYDMLSNDQSCVEVKWWQLEIMPVGGDSNGPEFLMATTHNITEQIIKEQEIAEGQLREAQLIEELKATNEELTAAVEELHASQEELIMFNSSLEETVANRTAELAASEAKWRALIEQSPVAIALLSGPDMLVDSVNLEMLKLWDKTKAIVGKTIIEALPEMEGQPYPAILQHVFKSGTPYSGIESEVKLYRNNTFDTGYFNFINHPIKGAEGQTENIVVVAVEVTAQVLARRAIEESESNLQALIKQARYPLMILRGHDLLVEIANNGIADLWNKPLDQITGRKLLDILPELAGQPFPALLENVLATGKSYGQEQEVFYLDTPDGTVQKYVSFYYDPILDNTDVSGIIVTAHDITEFVNSRKELERVYEQASLSKQAAELGTFDLDLVEGTMEWDARCRELFGISHNNEVSYEADFLPGLHEEDRERVNLLIAGLYDRSASNGDYDVEYRTVGIDDGRVRWVRAKGKVFFDARDKPLRFIGSVLDITDKKREEQRKNDFIGMVSHELKTPLTSIKGYVQMLHGRAKKREDTFAVPALLQVEKQVKKMTSMINGFLNLSRLESGNLHLNITVFDICALIREAISNVQVTTSTHELAFAPSAAIYVSADEDKIEHVISNILSNAMKYSAEGTAIEIRAEQDGANALISVRDKGIGIAENDIDKLFDRYYRVERADTKYISGFGIGLYLCAEIIKRHGGRIWAESKLAEGATFFFTLPLKAAE